MNLLKRYKENRNRKKTEKTIQRYKDSIKSLEQKIMEFEIPYDIANPKIEWYENQIRILKFGAQDNDNIIENLHNYLTELAIHATDERMKRRLLEIRDMEVVDYCKCPNCGCKFDVHDGWKGSWRLVSSKNIDNTYIPKNIIPE